MPKHVEARICRDCGTEFPLSQTERNAKRCPICRKRHAGAVYVRTDERNKTHGELRTEVRGHLWRPSRWPKPGRSPDDDATPQEGAK